jgi:hypothetical protein
MAFLMFVVVERGFMRMTFADPGLVRKPRLAQDMLSFAKTRVARGAADVIKNRRATRDRVPRSPQPAASLSHDQEC